ncbi:MAG: Na+/H+ antiporter subunit E [Anaerolineae bacterium]|nr:Na+/H+ antiporter subunit E [Thermoflexales bacterium]MDW8396616.1 Na+/H+ antiporter subunit E [Anaerolineae bacterium]
MRNVNLLAYLRLIALCLVLYLAVTANLELSNIVVGALLGLFIALVVRPTSETLTLARLPNALFNLVKYTLWLSVDILRNGIRVARIVLDPKLPIKPGIIAIKSEMSTELGIALNAHAITVTPGEQVVEIGDDGTLYTHCLDVEASAAGAAEAQRTRQAMLKAIFE